MIRFIFTFFAALLIPLSAAAQVGPPVGPPSGPPAAATALPSTGNPAKDAFKTQLVTPLFAPAIDYNNIARIENCRDEVPRKMRYHNCRDSRKIYDVALKKAKDQGKPLVMIFGFNKCPYCLVLHRQIFDPKRPMRDGNLVRYFSPEAIEDYGRSGEPLQMLYVNIHARSPHGIKLANELGVTDMAKARGWHRVWSPFVVFVNPENERLASQNYWEAPETHCDPIADFAANLEELGMIKAGKPTTERKRCKRKS